MTHKEDFDDDNYKSIEEKEMAVWSPVLMICDFCKY